MDPLKTNQSPLERLNILIEERAALALPGLLLDMETTRHTRRRTRPGCDCEYCYEKRYYTLRIAHLDYRDGARYTILSDEGVKQILRNILRRDLRIELGALKAKPY